MELNFDKMNGLVPAIIQDNSTRTVLMLGFMNQEAYQKTIETGKVTFFSRTRNQLWTKGETSGHYLDVVSISTDCDQDTLLIKVNPHGPVCHTGADTCWNEKNEAEDIMFLKELPGLHRQTARRNAREIIYHQPFPLRRKQNGPESGRRSCGNRHRSMQRH